MLFSGDLENFLNNSSCLLPDEGSEGVKIGCDVDN